MKRFVYHWVICIFFITLSVALYVPTSGAPIALQTVVSYAASIMALIAFLYPAVRLVTLYHIQQRRNRSK